MASTSLPEVQCSTKVVSIQKMMLGVHMSTLCLMSSCITNLMKINLNYTCTYYRPNSPTSLSGPPARCYNCLGSTNIVNVLTTTDSNYQLKYVTLSCNYWHCAPHLASRLVLIRTLQEGTLWAGLTLLYASHRSDIVYML